MSSARASAGADSQEASRLYRAIFRHTPSPLFIERFNEAAALLRSSASPEEIAHYRRALAAVGDLEALEVAARYRRRLRLLSASFRLAVYLAEAEPHTQTFLIKRRAARIAAFAAIGTGALHTAYKLAKGTILLAKVRDA
jgi:hypothetical protein